MNIPMRQKYVDEAIGIYMVFGVHANGNVDVSDGSRDVFTNIPREVGERIVAEHEKFREQLYTIMCDFSGAQNLTPYIEE